MNAPEASTSSNRVRSSSISGAYCALTSTSGICTTGKGTGAPTAHQQIRHADHDPCRDRVVHVVEVLVEGLPAGAEGVADRREDHAPECRAHEREDRVAPEWSPEDAGGDRDERARNRRDPPHEDGPVAPALEPALGPRELLRREVQPTAVALEVWPPAVDPDRPAEYRADRVPDRPRKYHRHPRAETVVELVPEEHDTRGERTCRERAGVHHHQLARGREHRVHEHEQEDRVQAVVTKQLNDPVGHDRGD